MTDAKRMHVAEGRPDAHPSLAWPEHSYLGMLEPQTREALLALGTIRAYQPGSSLMLEGDLSSQMFVLLEGLVRVLARDDEGARLIDLQGLGDTVGEMAALDSRPRSATVVAVEPVQAMVISAHDLHRFFQRFPDAVLAMNRMLSWRLREHARQLANLGSVDTRTRLARVLLALAERFGTSGENGLVLNVVLTQSELAQLISASEPAAHKALRSLREGGLVQTRYRQIMITNIEALNRIAYP